MEYSYIEKRYNVMGLASIEAFAGIKGGINGNCKDVYFVRVIGVNETFLKDIASMDETQTGRMLLGQGIYNRVGAFPKSISADMTDRYMKCYQSWLDTGKDKLFSAKLEENSGLGELLGTSCKRVLEIYHTCNTNLNESIEKNFIIKLLYWLDELAFGYLKEWNPKQSMKFVAQDVTKEQEYFFCYFLTLLGIDVLLLQKEADIGEKLDALHLSEQIILGEKKAVALGAYDSQKYVNRKENSCNTFRESGQVQAEAGNHRPRVVIPPNRHRASQNAGQGVRAEAGNPAQDTGQNGGGTMQGIAQSGRDTAQGTGQSGRGTAQGTGQRTGGTIQGSGSAAGNSGMAGSFGMGQREPDRTSQTAGRTSQAAGRAPYSPAGRAGQELAFEELAMRASSVVMIAIHDGKGDIIGSGSGIMIGRDGYILTNDHVARGGKYYSVRIENDDNMYKTDEIIKYNSLLDLAVIRIDRTLQPLPIYRGSKPLVRGQKVVAIGSPLGLFNSVSDGIISGFRRMKDVDMIQFTAPISHGSSGGAVLNMYGEVIGVSTAGIDEGQNINLAVGYEFINTFVRGFQ